MCETPNMILIYRRRLANTKYFYFLLGKLAIVFTLFLVYSAVLQANLPLDNDTPSRLRNWSCGPGNGNTKCEREKETRRKLTTIGRHNFDRAKDFVILFLVNDGDDVDLRRSLDYILRIGAGIPIVVSLSDSKKYLRESFSSLPVTFVETDATPSHAPFGSMLYKTVSTFGLSNNDGDLSNTDACPTPVWNTSINILNVSINTKEFVSYNFNASDASSMAHQPFGDSVYNAHVQKMAYANQNVFGNDDSASYYKETCGQRLRLKQSLRLLTDRFPAFKFAIVVDGQKYFSPHLITFFLRTAPLLVADTSLFCISGANPFWGRNTAKPPHQELLRVDHFAYGGAVLLPRNVVLEIRDEYKVPIQDPRKRQLRANSTDPMDGVVEWLSWWSRRRLRNCVVASMPRVCEHSLTCPVMEDTTFNLESLLRHKYLIDLMKEAATMQPITWSTLPCQRHTKPRLDKAKNKTSFVFYVKMNSVDDDLSLDYAFKCFGIKNHEPGVGGFENVYKLYWSSDPVFLIGVPYSKIISTLLPESNIYMVDMGIMSTGNLRTIHRAKDYENIDFNVTTVPYVTE